MIGRIAFFSALMCCAQALADEIWLGATTTLRDSGFLEVFLAPFEHETGHEVVVLAQSSGQIMRAARDGNVDLLLTHHPALEEAFLHEGYAIERLPIMASRYVLVGPRNDPLNLAGLDIDDAFEVIAGSDAVFVTRGDDSGTAMREAEIWVRNGLAQPENAFETGQGMGASLNIASALDGYIFSELASFLQFENRGNLEILVQNGDGLENIYAISILNPQKFGARNLAGAEELANYMQSKEAQDMINQFEILGLFPFTAPPEMSKS